MNKIYYTLLIGLASLSVQAQTSDDVLLSAMKDEMKRSMKELKLADFERPFFMMYGVQDQTQYNISGSLGALLESNKTHQRFKTTTRLLVGDYAFNDESLEDDLFAPFTPMDISLPLEDDYYGIRRAFWSSTDNVYREAARHFDKHKRTLKETGKKLSEIPHRSFAKGAAVKIHRALPAYQFDPHEWEDRVRKLSAIFLKYSSIQNSTVVLSFTEGYQYLVNSEGVDVKVPVRLATFAALAQSKGENGQLLIEQVLHLASTPDKLPSEKELENEIIEVLNKMDQQSKLPRFNDEYRGPVLLMGQAVADFLSSALFTGRESIFANDNIPKLTGFQFNDDQGSMDGKIGKTLMSKSLSIKAKPGLQSFLGMELLGSFDIDDEGIVPAPETTIIENGVLKTLLNNRTLTNPSQRANGFSSGPGVLEVRSTQKDSEKTLKQKLIEQARKEGLDYGIIVRDASGIGMGLLKVYMVSVKDGKETLAQNVIMDQRGFRPLRGVLGASGTYQAYNIGGGGPGAGPAQGSAAGLVSFIVPSAMLIEEVECQPFRMPSLIEEDYVPSPLN